MFLLILTVGIPAYDSEWAASLKRTTCSDNREYLDVTDDVLTPEGFTVTLGYQMAFLQFNPSSSGFYRFDLKAEDPDFGFRKVDPLIAIYKLRLGRSGPDDLGLLTTQLDESGARLGISRDTSAAAAQVARIAAILQSE